MIFACTHLRCKYVISNLVPLHNPFFKAMLRSNITQYTPLSGLGSEEAYLSVLMFQYYISNLITKQLKKRDKREYQSKREG